MAETLDATVPEAAAAGESPGETFALSQTIGALGLGIFSLLIGGLFPLLFGALAREGRITGAEIGLTATLETLSLGVTAGIAGAALAPTRLRAVALVGLAGLAASGAATAGASHGALMLVRTLAGVPEGLLLWLAIGLIARTATPERGAGVMALGQPVSQILFAVPLGALVIPRFGAAGAYLILAAAALAAAPLTALLPRGYSPVAAPAPGQGGFGRVGWTALFATASSVGAFTAAAVYLAPLAAFDRLSPSVLALTVTASLAAQIAGATLATVVAGRVRPIVVLVGCGAAALAGWALLAAIPAAGVFVATAAGLGFFAFLASPFLVAYIVEVDPSRRAALQSGAAQVVGAALGPLIASRVAGGADPRPALIVSGVLMVLGTGAFLSIRRHARPQAGRAGSGP